MSLEVGFYKIAFKIQLPGCYKKWLVNIFLKKDMQEKGAPRAFFGEIRNSIKAIIQEANTRRKARDLNDDCGRKDVFPKPGEASERKNIRVAPFMTEEVIFDIFKKWQNEFPDFKKPIRQRDFWKVLSLSTIALKNLNRISVLNFLCKQGILEKEARETRKIFVKMSPKSFEIITKGEKLEREKALEAKREEFIVSSQRFPSRALSLLETSQNLLSLQGKLASMEFEEGEIIEEISRLEEKLSKLRRDKTACLNKIQKNIQSINPVELDELLATALRSREIVLRKKK